MMRPSRPLAVGLLCLVATSGCAGMTRNERIAMGSISGVGAIAGGVLLFNAQSDCSGNSEDPNACTFGDQGADMAATVAGGLVVLSGVAFLVAAGYLLTQ